MRKAVIDIGSGSVLLLVAERTEAGWESIFESSRVTSLGKDVKQTGVLGETGVLATLAAVRDAYAAARNWEVHQILAAGTMALRIAENTPDFLARAEAQGTPIRVMSAEQEAEFGFLAVAQDPTFADHPRVTIFDPGGQSTEITVAERTETGWTKHFQRSFPIGTLMLRGEYLPMETPGPGDLLGAATALDELLGVDIRPGDPGVGIALGAPATDLVMVRNRWTDWQPARVHGAYLDYEEISKAAGWLSSLTDAEREAVPGVETGRGPTVHLGSLILERALNAYNLPGCYVSVRGWRWAALDLSQFD